MFVHPLSLIFDEHEYACWPLTWYSLEFIEDEDTNFNE